MSTFSMPHALTPDVKLWQRMNQDLSALMPNEMGSAVYLMTYPATNAAVYSMLGLGIASQALGLWIASVSGGIEFSQRVLNSLADEATRELDTLADETETAAEKARSATRTLITDAETFARDMAEVPAKVIEGRVHAPARKAREHAPTPAKASRRAARHEAEAARAAETITAPAKEVQHEDFHRPKAMARPKKPDDLKAISGVGPKLEKILNDLGIWTYAQIAKWEKDQIAWLDDHLTFRGRIDRDEWVKQAKALSRGEKKN